MLRFLKLLLMLLAIPAIGVASGAAIQYDLNKTLAKRTRAADGDLSFICDRDEPKNAPEDRAPTGQTAQAQAQAQPVPSFCRDFNHSVTLQNWSILVAAGGLALPLLFWLGALLAGWNRRTMALLFPPLVRLSLIVLAILSAFQGLLAAYTFYIGETYLTNSANLFILGLIGLGTLYVFLVLLKSAFTLGGRIETRIAGTVLDRQTHPKVHQVVNLLANRLGARQPDNIVAGLDPTFFVTSARVQLPEMDKPLKGETLFLSLPLCRLFSLEEFAAVVGHELGHFRGADTAYSLKFAPVYSGLGSAIQAMSDDRGKATHLMAAPALAALKFMYGLFARKEAAISRARELAADRAACEVSTAQALGTSLIKVAMFGWLWEHIQRNNIERLKQGLVTRNLSMAFANTVQHDIDHDKVGVHISELLEVEIPHPTDSHPTIKKRLEALTGQTPDFTMTDLRVPAENAIMVFDKSQTLEEELTVLEHRIMVSAGVVEMPEDHDITDEQRFDVAVLNGIYAIAAALVTADGRIDDQEIAVAEAICHEFLPNFQPVDFREYCYHPDQIPDHMETARFLGQVTTSDGRALILAMLQAIAEADHEASAEELQIINDVQAHFSQIEDED